MYIVTGGAGFIGSHIVKKLNMQGVSEIVVIDNLGKNDHYKNLCDCQIADYYDRNEFLKILEDDKIPTSIEAIFHQGACADTLETDGTYMMENNFSFSKYLLTFSLRHRIPFVYASSAATYGASKIFVENPEYERPLNVYGYSKLVFDQYVRSIIHKAESTVVGLRYFNVYGPREIYKGKMASMVYQLYCQLRDTGIAKLFEGTDGYDNGEQKRDFVYVGDVVNVNLHFASGPIRKGIVNVGTGKSRSFNDIVKTIISILGRGKIEYIPIPENIKSKYQSFTEADLTMLRNMGYIDEFTSLEDGIAQCLSAWNA